MKKSERLSNREHEAHLNEFKGALFEFLLAKKLSVHTTGGELAFLQSLSASDLNYFMNCERELHQRSPLLSSQLETLSSSVMREHGDLLFKNLKGVTLVGLKEGNREDSFYGEADLILLREGEKSIPLSLKLLKENSYANTKSAGVRSFLTSYFSHFESASLLQERLNYKIDSAFTEMASALCETASISYSQNWVLNWKEAGLSTLPGALNSHQKEILFGYYYVIQKEIETALHSFFKTDPLKFKVALLPLLGISDQELIQLIIYHDGTDNYLYRKGLMISPRFWENELEKMEFVASDQKKSYFEINLLNSILQIRLKPMNEFTVPALKVNCSIKLSGLHKQKHAL